MKPGSTWRRTWETRTGPKRALSGNRSLATGLSVAMAGALLGLGIIGGGGGGCVHGSAAVSGAAAEEGRARTGGAEEARLERYEFERPQMGVPFRMVIHAADRAAAEAGAEAAFGRVAALNRILSDYDPDSEASRLCLATPVGQPAPVSAELWAMVSRGCAMAEASGGAFDVTVGPMVNLWRRARRRAELPAASLVADARARTGWEKLRLDAGMRTVTFLAPGMRLDFGGIAKGYAADEAVRVLRERGLNRVLVAAAGDVVAWDPPPGQDRGWRLEVGGTGGTDGAEGPTPQVAWLRRMAVSTSGDLYQFVEIDGRRYSHIVDPVTGIGITHRSLVTVIAREGWVADSLSTAVSVLGPERGLRLVRRTPGAEVLVLVPGSAGAGMRRLESRGWRRWIGEAGTGRSGRGDR